jgi:hypothetical protein
LLCPLAPRPRPVLVSPHHRAEFIFGEHMTRFGSLLLSALYVFSRYAMSYWSSLVLTPTVFLCTLPVLLLLMFVRDTVTSLSKTMDAVFLSLAPHAGNLEMGDVLMIGLKILALSAVALEVVKLILKRFVQIRFPTSCRDRLRLGSRIVGIVMAVPLLLAKTIGILMFAWQGRVNSIAETLSQLPEEMLAFLLVYAMAWVPMAISLAIQGMADPVSSDDRNPPTTANSGEGIRGDHSPD